MLLETIRTAERTRIRERSLLDAHGVGGSLVWAKDLWQRLAEQVMPEGHEDTAVMGRLLNAGTLSKRIGGAIKRYPTRNELREVYRELADCLRDGTLFRA